MPELAPGDCAGIGIGRLCRNRCRKRHRETAPRDCTRRTALEFKPDDRDPCHGTPKVAETGQIAGYEGVSPQQRRRCDWAEAITVAAAVTVVIWWVVIAVVVKWVVLVVAVAAALVMVR